MKWSWKFGTVAGIDLYVHATFFLLIAWVGITYWLAGGSAAALSGIAFILALFACVVLHELGHALTARRYGIRTRDITLLPIGGVSRLERIPDDPRQEVWVSLAGPAVNVVIAAVLYAWLLLSQTSRPLSVLTMARGPFLERLLLVNVSLAVFNLLPAFPMDGGRVLRALLAMRMDYVRATQVSAHVGQAMALVFGLLGLFTNPFLVFIALFVWIGAAQEASMVQMRTALSGIPVSRAMLTDFHTVAPDDTAKRVLELILAGSQQDFPVLDGGQGSQGGRLSGVLLRSDVLKALAQRASDWRVRDIMRREFEVVDAADMLERPSRGCSPATATRCRSQVAVPWWGSSRWKTWASSCSFSPLWDARHTLERPSTGFFVASNQPPFFPWPFKIRTIATMVFQFRAVAGAPNSLSIRPR